jgi:hypothetical protein
LKGSKEETNEQCSQKFETRDLVITLSQYHQVCCSRGDLFKCCGTLLDVVVFLHYPHHPHLSLDHLSPLKLDHGAHIQRHVHLDQAFVWVEWCHLGNDPGVDHSDLAILYHQ